MKLARPSCRVKKPTRRGSRLNAMIVFVLVHLVIIHCAFLLNALSETSINMCTTKVRGQREQLKTENQALKKELVELKRVQAERVDRDAKLV